MIGPRSFEHLCELADGTPLTPGEIVPHLHRSDLERIVFDTPDRVMSISHRRTFPAAVKRAIAIRDRRCTHPSGCDEPAQWCDTDHHHEHSNGGETSEANGRLLCLTHNRNDTLRHRAPPPDTPRTRRPPRGWTFTTPNLAHHTTTTGGEGDRASADDAGTTDPSGTDDPQHH